MRLPKPVTDAVSIEKAPKKKSMSGKPMRGPKRWPIKLLGVMQSGYVIKNSDVAKANLHDTDTHIHIYIRACVYECIDMGRCFRNPGASVTRSCTPVDNHKRRRCA